MEANGAKPFSYNNICANGKQTYGSNDTDNDSTIIPANIVQVLRSLSHSSPQMYRIDVTVLSSSPAWLREWVCGFTRGLETLQKLRRQIGESRNKNLKPLRKEYIAVGTQFLLKSFERAEISSVEEKRVYLLDKGKYLRLNDWDYFEMPPVMANIPPLAILCEFPQPRKFVENENLTLLLTDIHVQPKVCNRICAKAIQMDVML